MGAGCKAVVHRNVAKLDTACITVVVITNVLHAV